MIWVTLTLQCFEKCHFIHQKWPLLLITIKKGVNMSFWSSFMTLSSIQAKRPLIPNLHKTDYYREANTAQTMSSQSPRAHSSGRKRPLNIWREITPYKHISMCFPGQCGTPRLLLPLVLHTLHLCFSIISLFSSFENIWIFIPDPSNWIRYLEEQLEETNLQRG